MGELEKIEFYYCLRHKLAKVLDQKTLRPHLRKNKFVWDSKNGVWITDQNKRIYDLFASTGLQMDLQLADKYRDTKNGRFDPVFFPTHSDIETYLDSVTLKPFQKEGVDFLLSRNNAILGDDMGLGKTLQAISCMLFHLHKNKKFKVLVVCPKGVKFNWKCEIKKFSKKKLDIKYFDKNTRKNAAFDVLLSHYEQLEHLNEKDINFDMIIVDEAHFLKHKDTLRTAYLFGGRKKIGQTPDGKPVYEKVSPIRSDYTILLTGTPITRCTMDFFTLLNRVSPFLFPNRFQFGLRYCSPKKNYFRYEFKGSSNITELQDRIKPFFLRREKETVLPDLPEKTRSLVFLQGEPSLTEKTFVAEATENRQFDGFVDLGGLLTKKFKIDATECSRLRLESGLAKVEPTIEYLAGVLPGLDKLVCFGHHREVLQAIHAAFKKESVLVYGGTKDVGAQVSAFNKDPKIKLFIGNIQTAGTGINLTASSTMIVVEPDWLSEIMRQVEDRVWRIGQENRVEIRYLAFKESFDELILKNLEKTDKNVREVIGRC